MEKDVDIVIDNEKNKFFSIFQHSSIKHKIEEAKNDIEDNYYHQSILKNEMNRLNTYTPSIEVVKEHFESNLRIYHSIMRDYLKFDSASVDGMLRLIEEKVNQLTVNLEEFSINTIDKHITEAWESVKVSNFPKEIHTLPLDILKTDSELEIPINKLLDSGIQTIGDVYFSTQRQIELKALVSTDEVTQLFVLTNNFVSKHQKRFYPKINSD